MLRNFGQLEKSVSLLLPIEKDGIHYNLPVKDLLCILLNPITYMMQVTCAIIRDNGLILVCQRGPAMSMPLKWEFPGGKLEQGEDEIECIHREIKEELNIEINILQRLRSFSHKYPSFEIELIPFLVEIKGGEILLKEHLQYKWVHKKEMLALDWAAADLPIVQEILKHQ